MNTKLTDKDLLKLIEKSNRRVDVNNTEYYYSVDDYKIDNAYLATWYEQRYNKFVNFVSPKNIKEIKKVLEDKTIDLKHNYTVDFIKKLRNKNQYLQLMLSGGIDSVNILINCVEHDIYIDEIISVITGDSIDLPENHEIKFSAVKYAEKFRGKYGKYTIHKNDRDFIRNFYKDPFVYFKEPEIGGTFPFMRQSFRSLSDIVGKRILGTDKPKLIKHKNRWYTICYDHNLNGNISLIKQSVKPSYEPENIKSLIKDSILYRDYLIKNQKVSNQTTEFFDAIAGSAESYGKIPIEFANKMLNKNSNKVWPEKDILAITDILENHDLELFIRYSHCLKNLLDIMPNFDYKIKKINHGKFCWAIDIDSLEIFTQQELIPNGFNS